MMNGETKIGALSESVGGAKVTGIINPEMNLQKGHQLVSATIHLDHLSEDDVLKLIKILEPYDKNLELKTTKDLQAGVSLGDLRLNSEAGLPASGVQVNGLNGQINAPSFKGGISTPTVNADIPGTATPIFSVPRLKTPAFGMSAPNLEGAGLNGTVETPDISVSTPSLNTPDVSVNVDKPELKTKTPKFKMPNFNLQAKKPKFDGDVNLTAPDLKNPNLSLSAPKIDGELDTPEVDMSLAKTELSGPNLDIETPKVNIEPPSGKFKFKKFKKGKTTKVKVPEASVDANLNAPNLALSAPKLNAGVSAPNVDIDLPRANLEAPDLDVQTPDVDIGAPSGKVKFPTFKKHTKKVKSPEVGLDANVSTPDLSLSAPKIDGDISITNTDVNLKAPDVDVHAPSAKHKFSTLKMPKLHLHKSKVKTPDLNTDIQASDVNISAPKVDVNLPKAELEGPNLDVKAPNLNLSAPDLDIKTPTVDVQAPDIEIEAPSGKLKKPHFKLPKINLSGSKIKGPDVDLNAQADLQAPNLNLSAPNLDITTPTVDVQEPDIDIEAPSGKLKKPHIKLPKMNLSGSKIKGPDVDLNAQADLQAPDLDLKTPDLSLSAPKVEGKLNAPDVDLNLPDVNIKSPNVDLKAPDIDLNAPKVDIDAPSGKVKLPHLKFPKFGLSGSRVKTPKLDAPDVDVNIPTAELQGPNVDVKTPDLSLSTPKVEGDISAPSLDVGLPKPNLKAPTVNIGGNLKSPNLQTPHIDINMPKAELEGPDANLKVPDVDINATSPKFKMPHFNLPKLNLSEPKVKVPDLDANADLDLSVPKLEGKLNAQGVDLNLPKAEISAPDVNATLPKAEFSVPSVDVNSPDFKTPSGKLKMITAKKPKVDLSGPNVKSPEIDINAETPYLSLSAPTVDTDVKVPDADLKLPTADVDINTPKGKLKLPKFKGFNLSGPKVKSPDANIAADVNGPSLNLSAPEVGTPEVDMSLPNAGVDVDIPAADADINAPKGKMKLPKFKGFNLSGPKVKSPDANIAADVNGPSLHLSAPEVGTPEVDMSLPNAGVDVDIPAADVDINTPKGKMKLPTFKGFNLSGPKVKSPDANIAADVNGPSLHLSAPEVSTPEVDMNLPNAGVDVNIPTTDVEINAPKGKMKFPTMKRFNWSSPKVKSPDVDIAADVSEPNLNLSAPSIGTPDVDMSLPNAGVDVPGITAEAEGSKRRSKWPFKWRKSVDSKDEDININAPEVDGTTSEIELPQNIPIFRTHSLPVSNIDTILKELVHSNESADHSSDPMETISDAVVSASSIKTNLKASSPSVEVNGQTVSVDIQERLRLSNARTTSPDFSMSSETDSPTKVNRGTFKLTKPDVDKDYPVVDTTSKEDDDKITLSLNNMLCLQSD